MADEGSDKTEAPTPKRREEARLDGNIAQSTDLGAAASLFGAVWLLYFFGLKLLSGFRVIFEKLLSTGHAANSTRATDIASIHIYILDIVGQSLAPLIFGIAAIGFLAMFLQVGFLITGKPLELDITKLSPLKGVQNLFSMRGGIRLIMSLAKVGVITIVAWVAISQEMQRIVRLSELEVAPMLGLASHIFFVVALKIATVLILLAILDYAFQKWQHEQDLKMSKQDLKDEMKRMDGDPQMKQRRARVAKQLAMQRMGQAVPGADVIVTNPTHFAIALRYESGAMQAPKVVAKGADLMALRIRQIAMKNAIPIVERKEIARALYPVVEVGQEVPPQFYGAIAEILAYVYRLSGKKTA